MKKIFLFAFLVFVTAECFSEEESMHTGLIFGYETCTLERIGYTLSFDDIPVGYNDFILGAYFDTVYIRPAIYFTLNHDNHYTLNTTNESYFLHFSLSFKFPLSTGIYTFYPAAGLKYSHCLSYKIEEKDWLKDANTDLNDYFLFAGGIAEIRIEKLVIGINVLYNLNLTPNPEKTPVPENVLLFGYNILGHFTVGMLL